MKVYLSNYRDHWISPYTIMEKVIFWREIDYDEPFIRRCNKVLSPLCTAWMNILNVIHPKIEYVKINRWDTWSMYHTLAHIILPMLKQLRDTKHGSPMVEDEDVPEELRTVKKLKRKKKDVRDTMQVHAVDMEDDSLVHKKWDWVLNEMIWAFEQKVKDDDESSFFDHSAYEGDDRHHEWFNDMSKGLSKLKVDWDGLKAHQERKENGFKLFGKYYQGLWD